MKAEDQMSTIATYCKGGRIQRRAIVRDDLLPDDVNAVWRDIPRRTGSTADEPFDFIHYEYREHKIVGSWWGVYDEQVENLTPWCGSAPDAVARAMQLNDIEREQDGNSRRFKPVGVEIFDVEARA